MIVQVYKTLIWMFGKYYTMSTTTTTTLLQNSLYYSVPVCPICEKPVPVKRSHDPNIRVGFSV